LEKIIKVLIIGLGNIAYKYDANLPNNYILTHLRAFEQHSNFSVVGVIDKSKKAIKKFTDNFNYKAFCSIRDASKILKPELIVVSSPPNTHLKVVEEIFTFCSPKYLVCEKPLADDLKKSKKIIQICKKNKCILFINFQRNSSITSNLIKTKISNNEFLPPYRVVMWYSRGFENTASHFITLFNSFFGKSLNSKIIDSKNSELYFKIDYKNCEAFFIPVVSDFFYNSFELICKNGKLIYENGGETSSWFPIDDSKKSYSEYNILSKVGEPIKSDFYHSQYSFVENIWKFIQGEKHSICMSENVTDTLEIINYLKIKKNEIR
jgi:predicted dehydrogenase